MMAFAETLVLWAAPAVAFAQDYAPFDTPPSFLIWQAIIAGFVTIVVAYLQLRTTRAVVKASARAEEQAAEVAHAVGEVAVKADTVREVLEVNTSLSAAKMNSLQLMAKDTHRLVNSNMEVQLQLNASVTRRLANVTKHKDDITAAKQAEKLLKEHQRASEIADKAP